MIVIEVGTRSGKYLIWGSVDSLTQDVDDAQQFDSLGKAIQYKNDKIKDILGIVVSEAQAGYNKTDISVTELCEICLNKRECSVCYNTGFVKRIVTTVEFTK